MEQEQERARVRVVDRIRVSPAPADSSSPQVQEDEVPLTFFDVAWLFTGPVERLFFFRHPDPASALPPLRSSLSIALRRFYPLAGTISPHPPVLCSSYAHGLDFALAESDSPGDFDRLVARSPRDLAGIRPLVPQLPPPAGESGAFALAAVQATIFPGRGLCLGISVHHAACDDASATHFVRTWAAACRQLQNGDGHKMLMLPPPPVLDRSLVADPDDLRGKTFAGMMRLAPPPPQPQEHHVTRRTVLASFLLTRHQIDQIKEGAAAAAKVSSFVAASALAWVCLLRSGSVGVAGAERSHMLFSADCRSRLTPPLPAEYFGNCLRPCFVEAATADLLSGSGEAVAAAAAAIGGAIREIEQGVLEGAEGWLGRVMQVLPERPMSVGGSPRHGVYESTDFGWGRPARVEMVSVERTPGTVALAESPEGDGGVELGVVLLPDAMDAFARCFAHAVGGATI